MNRMKLWCGAGMMTALLLWPETALNAAREAMHVWYKSVAPALFPFMALMPMLTCEASAQAWERLLGRAMRPLFGLPGAAAPAVAVGMIAGSPAGTRAAMRCRSLSTAQVQRIICCTGGLSPAFLITGVGAAMLGSPAAGRILMRAQLLSQLAMLLLTRRSASGAPREIAEEETDAEPIRTAVAAVLGVCGYMMLFSIAAALISRMFASPAAGFAALCLLDMPSAARAVSAMGGNMEGKVLLIAALMGFGGLCIAAQNLAAAKKSGLSAGKYLSARACHAMFCTAFAAVQLRIGRQTRTNWLPTMEFSALTAVFLLVPALISLKKDLFLNKRNFEKQAEN